MTRLQTGCSNEQAEFRIDELFFSTTDRQGVIQYGNAVFTRVSGYEESELLGKAHSVIRHPHMPRAVFQLFWDTIQADQTIAAYVKNRAKGGEYYWVMAVAAPVDGGYLSVRLKPSSPVFELVQQVYQTVWADEQAAAAEGVAKQGVIEVGTASLMSELRRLGFDDYESFMHHALASEMMARQQALGTLATDPRLRSSNLGRASAPGVINQLAQANGRCDQLLTKMLQQLTTLQVANSSLLETSDAILQQSENIGMVAMNANVSANTAPLRAVAQALGEVEHENRDAINQLNTSVDTLVTALNHLAFEVSVAALQGEICSHFLAEIQASGDLNGQALQSVLTLLGESDRRLVQLIDRLDEASMWFRELEFLTGQLHRNARTLRFIRLAGVKEAAQLEAGHAFRGLFDGVESHIRGTMSHCGTLRDQTKEGKSALNSLVSSRLPLSQGLEQVRSGMSQLQAVSV